MKTSRCALVSDESDLFIKSHVFAYLQEVEEEIKIQSVCEGTLNAVYVEHFIDLSYIILALNLLLMLSTDEVLVMDCYSYLSLFFVSTFHELKMPSFSILIWILLLKYTTFVCALYTVLIKSLSPLH